MAIESHHDLNLPYTDPFTAKKRRISDALKQDLTRSAHKDQFRQFCEAIRKREGFLRKATENELQGIFERLTPAERQRYIASPPAAPAIVKPAAVKEAAVVIPAPKRKSIAKAMDDFINDDAVDDEEHYSDDYSSDDVSLVSETGAELVETNEDLGLAKRSKKDKKDKKKAAKKEKEAVTAATRVTIKNFTWQ